VAQNFVRALALEGVKTPQIAILPTNKPNASSIPMCISKKIYQL